jgi:hypothetical protein
VHSLEEFGSSAGDSVTDGHERSDDDSQVQDLGHSSLGAYRIGPLFLLDELRTKQIRICQDASGRLITSDSSAHLGDELIDINLGNLEVSVVALNV